jgi:hypothetical protein
MIHDRLGRLFLFISAYGHGNAMLVRPANMNDVIALEAMIANIDIRRQICSREMTQMDITVRVRQSTGYQNSHGEL